MNSHLQWTIYLVLYYPQTWNSCSVRNILFSGMMDPHCQIIVTYWWWSVFCIFYSSEEYKQKTSKFFYNSSASTQYEYCKYSYITIIHDCSPSTLLSHQPTFLPLHSSKNQDTLELCTGKILTMCFVFCTNFYLSIILRVIQRQIVQIEKHFRRKSSISAEISVRRLAFQIFLSSYSSKNFKEHTRYPLYRSS